MWLAWHKPVLSHSKNLQGHWRTLEVMGQVVSVTLPLCYRYATVMLLLCYCHITVMLPLCFSKNLRLYAPLFRLFNNFFLSFYVQKWSQQGLPNRFTVRIPFTSGLPLHGFTWSFYISYLSCRSIHIYIFDILSNSQVDETKPESMFTAVSAVSESLQTKSWILT
jgi:hypothetical protein